MASLQKLLEQHKALKQKIVRVKNQQWREKKRAIEPTLDNLKEALAYDPETGLFTWKVKRNSAAGKIEIGSVAGTLRPLLQKNGVPDRSGGYIQIVVDQRAYRANRLAWWFMTGEPAPKGIDVEHENRDRADNKWKNLRLATRSQNNCNSKIRVTNTSGAKGVHRVNNQTPGSKPWFARITINKKIIHLGCFDTVEEAAEARRQAEIQHHGEFRAK